MNHRQIDSIQSSFFSTGEEGEKMRYVRGIRLDAVFRQPSFRNKVVEIQFLCCTKLGREFRRFNSASAFWLSGTGPLCDGHWIRLKA